MNLDETEIYIEDLAPCNLSLHPNGGICISWSSPQIGYGETRIFWDEEGFLCADTETLGKEFLEKLLSKLVHFIFIVN